MSLEDKVKSELGNLLFQLIAMTNQNEELKAALAVQENSKSKESAPQGPASAQKK